jgi:hypothetical protein
VGSTTITNAIAVISFYYFFFRVLTRNFRNSSLFTGAWGGVVVKAMRYKSEGPGIDSRCSVASDSFMCPGIDSASENEYQVNPGGKGGRCVRLTTYHLHVPMSRNLRALTSWNPVGLFRPVMGQLYLLVYWQRLLYLYENNYCF